MKLKKIYFSLLILVLVIVFFPQIFYSNYQPLKSDWQNISSPPSFKHPFGTDETGKDILSIIILGIKPLFYIGIISAFLSIMIGILIGLTFSYHNILANSFSLFLKIFDFIPPFFIILFITTLNGYSSLLIIISIIFFRSLYFAHLTTSWIQKYQTQNFYLYSKMLGKSKIRIFFEQIIKLKLDLIFNFFINTINYGIFLTLSLNFLGIDSPSQPSLGKLLFQGWDKIIGNETTAWWIAGFPIISIIFIFFLLNYTYKIYKKEESWENVS